MEQENYKKNLATTEAEESLEEKETSRELEELRSRAEDYLREVFDEYKTNKERIEAILLKIDPFLSSILINGEEIRRSLEACSAIEDKEQFVKKAFLSLEPLIDLKAYNLEEYQRIQRKIFNKDLIEINDVLSYGISEEKAHIHLPHSEGLIDKFGGKVVVGLFEDGLRELAKIIKKNNHIEKISAKSELVFKHQFLIKKLGFEIEGPISPEEREARFSTEKGEIWKANITRDDFLAKYGEQ